MARRPAAPPCSSTRYSSPRSDTRCCTDCRRPVTENNNIVIKVPRLESGSHNLGCQRKKLDFLMNNTNCLGREANHLELSKCQNQFTGYSVVCLLQIYEDHVKLFDRLSVFFWRQYCKLKRGSMSWTLNTALLREQTVLHFLMRRHQ